MIIGQNVQVNNFCKAIRKNNRGLWSEAINQKQIISNKNEKYFERSAAALEDPTRDLFHPSSILRKKKEKYFYDPLFAYASFV